VGQGERQGAGGGRYGLLSFPKSTTHCFISQLVTVVHTSRYTILTLSFTYRKRRMPRPDGDSRGARRGETQREGKYFPITTFLRLIAHTRLTFIHF
jgi:hypothetical protein